ncbi:hypothetical protein [Chromobacterium amazonense]|uniref:hypothetical protein n=1 Tax=Chromobacterium amazonense TaxID=1382803 RepID=UPI0011B1CD0B|nr:hypothetical protein [Chromobacterium amazonense]
MILQEPNEEFSSDEKAIYYDYENRKLILDNTFVIACFRSGSFNQELFEYLNKNQEIEVSIEKLKADVIRGREVDLNKVVDAMGFKGDLKKLLFTHTSKSISYHPSKYISHTGIISVK